MMLTFIRTLITEDEADTVLDPLRIAFALTFLAAIFALTIGVTLEIVAVIWALTFDVQAYCIGVAALVAGIGTLILTTGGALWASSRQNSTPGSAV